MSVGFAIVGCGAIGYTHAEALRNLVGGHLVGCFDRDPVAAERLAAEFGGRAFNSLDELLACNEVLVATIATPSGNHLEPALELAQAGKHLLVEKPLEVSVARCDELIAAGRAHQVKIASIFPLRFSSAARKMQQAVTSPEFGTPVVAHLAVKGNRSSRYFAEKPWRGLKRDSGGGVLMNQAIHGIDLLRWWLGPVSEVYAQTAQRVHRRLAVEDTATATLKFANGTLGTIEATTAIHTSYRMQIAAHGSVGSAFFQDRRGTRRGVEAAERPARGSPPFLTRKASRDKALGHRRQFRDFVRALGHNHEPAVGGAAGREAVALVQAMYESAETGRPVQIAPPDDS